MNKNEQLAILDSIFQQMESMSEDQFFNYMMDNSLTFRNYITELRNMDNIPQRNIRFINNVSKAFVSIGKSDIWINNNQIVA